MVTFQDMVKNSQLNYAKIEKLEKPYDDIKEEPVNNSDLSD